MRLTHGEIRGTIALGCLLACLLGVLAAVRGCGVRRVQERTESYELPAALGTTSNPNSTSTSGSVSNSTSTPNSTSISTSNSASVDVTAEPPDSTAVSGTKKKRHRTDRRPAAADRPSPLDVVNSPGR